MLLGEKVHTGILAATGTYSETLSVTLPNGIEGAYYLLVKTDAAGEIVEGDDWKTTSAYQA